MKSYVLLMAMGFFGPRAATIAQNQGVQKDTMYYVSPVIVTATQAVERLTPVTFTDFNRHQLIEHYSTQDVPVLLSDLPSMTFYSENGNGLGYNYLNLRGFDQRRVSVMVNGIPQNDPEEHNVYWIDMPDLLASTDHIQVQRGAGSAFYGPPAIGGSINIVATPFKAEPSVTLESILGFQEIKEQQKTPLSTRKYSVSVNSGLVNQRYMLYGRLSKITTDGYRERAWVDLNSYFLGAVRFDESMTTRLNFYGGPFSDGLVFTGLPKFVNSNYHLRRENLSDGWTVDSTGQTYTYAAQRRPQEVESFTQPHLELLHEWRLSPGVTLSNTIFYVIGEGYFDYDGNWIPAIYAGVPSASNLWFQKYIGYDSTFGVTLNPSFLIRGFVGNKQWGWLPRMEFKQSSGMLDVGAEVRIHRSLHWGKIAYASQLPSPDYDPDNHFYEYNGEKDIVSVYAHELYRMQDNVTLLADLQFIYNRYGIANEKFLHHDFSLAYYFLNPRVGINFNPDEEWNMYASAGYTSREPTLRNLYAAEDAYWGATPQFDTTRGGENYDFSKPYARPERLLDIELGTGYKSGTARVTANFFWMEFSDELVKTGQVDIFGQPITVNADRTRHLGIELDGSYSADEHFVFSGNLTISRNRVVNFSVIDNNTTTLLDGNPVAGFPDLLGNFRATYTDESFTASFVEKYVGSFYTDNFKNEANRNDEYAVSNVEVLCRVPISPGAEVTIRGEVRNLFDRPYLMSGEGNAFFPAAERNYLVGMTVRL